MREREGAQGNERQSNKREIVPMFAKLGPAFKGSSQTIADELKAQSADAVEELR